VTKRRAELLTGYDVRRISNSSSAFCYGAFCGEDLVVEAQHRKESIALTMLVNSVYQIHSRRVLDEQGWRCVHCGRSYSLQIHHRKFRSHGGTHRPENLEPVCWECHRRIHARQSGFS
jgi:HNH endonuclease